MAKSHATNLICWHGVRVTEKDWM